MSPGLVALRRRLLNWYESARRDLPWRMTRDPYRIWVSEIMLQQTRVAAVLPYFDRFLAQFPDVAALARAPEQDVLAAWSGLGYYSRARNLHKAASLMVANGGFPRRHAEILALPGIGDYTAAAIASIAFGQPHAVLDGNVARVLARLLAEPGDIQAASTRRRLREAAGRLLDRRAPGTFNQALMELGATLCVPRDPQCSACPLAGHCAARTQGREREFPVKLRRARSSAVVKQVLIVESRGCILLWQRGPESTQLAGFWELPELGHLPGAAIGSAAAEFRHSITNKNYLVTVVRAHARRIPARFRWVPIPELERIPLSTIARKALAAGIAQNRDRQGAVSVLSDTAGAARAAPPGRPCAARAVDRADRAPYSGRTHAHPPAAPCKE